MTELPTSKQIEKQKVVLEQLTNTLDLPIDKLDALRYACTYSSFTTIMFLSFRADRSGQTVQTQIRLLLEEQSDQGLHCLQFPLHLLDALL